MKLIRTRTAGFYTLAALATVGLAAGTGYLGARIGAQHASSHLEANPMVLKAETAASADQMSMVTGIIENGVHGSFVLDHVTGELSCWLMNVKTGEIAAKYVFDVGAVLNPAKRGEADYVMVSGFMDFQIGRSSGDRNASTVVWVGDGNTGNVVALTVQYNRQNLAGRIIQLDTAATRAGIPQRRQ